MIEVFLFGIVLGLIPITLAGIVKYDHSEFTFMKYNLAHM